MAYQVGDRVTLIKAGMSDPIKLQMSRAVAIAEVVEGPDGPSYMVWHPAEHVPGTEPYLYGPISHERLSAGWTW